MIRRILLWDLDGTLNDISINDEKVIMIGDTEYDILGAKEYGIPTVIVKWGYGDYKKIQERFPYCEIVETMEQLKAVIGVGEE